MRTPIDSRPRLRWLWALALVTAAAAIPPVAAEAGSGGLSSHTGTADCQKPARLRNGKAIAPRCAPRKVKLAIDAANDIAKGHGYCLGGGHSSWKSSCYDCSGAVSYALHGARLLDHPLDSSGLARWGRRGKGDWMTIYGNGGHAFMTIAGLRFDTSDTAGAGPGWAKTMGAENPRDYAKRQKKAL